MKKLMIGLTVFVWNPASAAELELSDVEIRAGIPYVQEYILPEGEEESEYLNRGPRSYQNPEYEGDIKRHICVLDYLRTRVAAARDNGNIASIDSSRIMRVLLRDRQDVRNIDKRIYRQNSQFFRAGIRLRFNTDGIEYCNG